MAKGKFDYMITADTKKELTALGITFKAVAIMGEQWPGMVLPSGTVLAFSRDDEGNGPGAIHELGS